MALYYELPIYKTSYDLLVEIFKFSKNFSREYKFTIGKRLKNETIEMITNIYKANKTHNKVEFIDKACENTEIIRLYLRVLKDLRQIGLKRHIAINEKIKTISLCLISFAF